MLVTMTAQRGSRRRALIRLRWLVAVSQTFPSCHT
jgi:hypothetical protein